VKSGLSQNPLERWLTKKWRGHKIFATSQKRHREASQCEPRQEDYRIAARHEGFRPLEVLTAPLEINQSFRADLKLEVGTANEQVFLPHI
jgi:hypothetical protein